MLKELQTKLLAMNVNHLTEKKNNLTYLSWAKAWEIIITEYPDATYTIKKNPNGTPEFGSAKFGYMVYTDVTIEGITREMWLFVMNGANKSLKDEPYQYKDRYGKVKDVEAINMFDINKTVMRCLVKNLAMFGLALYVFSGEDLPTDLDEPKTTEKPETTYVKKEGERKITTQQLIDIAANKGYDEAYLKEKYKVSDVKYIKSDIKLQAYDKLMTLKDK